MKNFPNAFVIMVSMIVFTFVMTFLVPKGSYDRITDPESGITRVVNGSYHEVDPGNLGFFDLLIAFPEGVIGRADLIVLILMLGGCFYVIEKTGAISQGLTKLVSLFEGKESLAVVFVSLAFAVGGATIGLHEEIIALTPIMLLFMKSLGYDRYVVVMSSLGSATIGSSFSPMNPFAILIAQGLAELPLLSGAVFRSVVMAIVFIAWMSYLLYYANRHKVEKTSNESVASKMSINSAVILILLVGALVISAYGLLSLDWGFNEMSGTFFILGIVSGLIGQLGINGTGEAYGQGFKEMAYAAVIIGLANSITLLLSKGVIIDTLVETLFGSLQYLPAYISAVLMQVGHFLLHFPVPSSSGQAMMTMPVLIPLSDLIGLSRQTCTLAYQYGGAFADIFVPTNGALVAILAILGIRYDDWVKFIWKPFAIVMAISATAIIVAVLIDYR